MIKPSLIKKKMKYQKTLVSKKTSKDINNILRKVVTDKDGTASLADIYGYDVGGKNRHITKLSK